MTRARIASVAAAAVIGIAALSLSAQACAAGRGAALDMIEPVLSELGFALKPRESDDAAGVTSVTAQRSSMAAEGGSSERVIVRVTDEASNVVRARLAEVLAKYEGSVATGDASFGPRNLRAVEVGDLAWVYELYEPLSGGSGPIRGTAEGILQTGNVQWTLISHRYSTNDPSETGGALLERERLVESAMASWLELAQTLADVLPRASVQPADEPARTTQQQVGAADGTADFGLGDLDRFADF